MIVVGGVIPPQDFDALRAAGAAAIFPPGTVIADAALRPAERARRRTRTRRRDGADAAREIDVDDCADGRARRRPGARSPARSRWSSRAGPTTASRPSSCWPSCCRTPARPSGSASPACPGVGKSTFIDALGMQPDRRRAPGRGARRRPVLDPHRRQHPRRQDPDDPAGRRPERAFVRPSPTAGHARRRRQGDPRDDAGDGGGRLRRRAGRDGRRRPVRVRRWPTWSTRSCS